MDSVWAIRRLSSKELYTGKEETKRRSIASSCHVVSCHVMSCRVRGIYIQSGVEICKFFFMVFDVYVGLPKALFATGTSALT